MIEFLTKQDFRNYINLPKNFDADLLYSYQENCFRTRIFPVFPEELYLKLAKSEVDKEQQLYRLISKAASGYIFLMAIPRLKVQLTNYGIEQLTQDKSKAAPWYDVRDYGISLVKQSDEAMSDAIDMAMDMPTIKQECLFFKNFDKQIIKTPNEFNAIYPIAKSLDVYRLLAPIMRRVWDLQIAPLFGACNFENLAAVDSLVQNLKEALVYLSIDAASRLGQFCFLNAGIVFQYDELPWQKSLILSATERSAIGANMASMAKELLAASLKIAKNTPGLSCFNVVKNTPNTAIVAKKSGLYL